MNRRKASLLIVLQLLIAALTFYAVSLLFRGAMVGFMAVEGTMCFRFFTNDSNILNVFSSLVLLPALISAWKREQLSISKAVLRLQLAGTVGVSITFLTVMGFLVYVIGFEPMLGGGNLYLHLVCPLLTVLTYALTAGQVKLSVRDALWGMLPFALYTHIYLACVKLFRVWPDFYRMDLGKLWFISYFAMLLFGFGISMLFVGWNNRMYKNRMR